MAFNQQYRSMIDLYSGRTSPIISAPNTVDRYIQDPTNPTASIPNPNYQPPTYQASQTTQPTSQTQTTQPPQIDTTQFQTEDPLRKFNLALMDMLKKAQSGETAMGQERAQLTREAYRSGREVFQGQEALMTPVAKMAALQRNVEMFEPSVQAATTKINQLRDITGLIIQTYGEDFAKLLPVTKEDAQVFKDAMAVGFAPPADILEKYGKFFTTEDWDALLKAQQKALLAAKTPTEPKAPAVIKTDEGSFQYNPASGFYDIRVGGESTTSSDKVAAYQDSIDLVDSLKTSPQLPDATGLGLEGAIERFWRKLTGGTQQFIGGVEQIVSQFSLNALIEAKSRGATFGALSEGEMRILASSATKLGAWAVRDKYGKVTGYSIDKDSFMAELDEIRKVLERNRGVTGGNIITQPDGTQWQQNADGSYTRIK